jgi:hypothetical protein
LRRFTQASLNKEPSWRKPMGSKAQENAVAKDVPG